MVSYLEIEKVNSSLEQTTIGSRNYVTVSERVKAFRTVYPNGCIDTNVVDRSDSTVLIKATIFDEQGKILATAHAQEMKDSNDINRTSYIENCETSAIGRALGFCGFGIEKSIASAEEVSSALAKRDVEDLRAQVFKKEEKKNLNPGVERNLGKRGKK